MSILRKTASILLTVLLFAVAAGCTLIDDISQTVGKSSDDVESAQIGDVTVTDALNYEKDVIVAPEYKSVADQLEGMKHKLCLPKINAKTKNVTEFNKKIYDEFSKAYTVLENNEEDKWILTLEYKYAIYDGIIGIIVFYTAGEQFSEPDTTHYGYFYDIASDKEITYDEYLAKLGFNSETLEEKVKKTTQYTNSEYDFGKVHMCILDKSKTFVCCELLKSLDGWAYFEADPII